MRVLVTGAGGFIGRRIVARLRAASDVDVAAATHQDLDVTDPAAADRVLAGVDALVHTAVGDRQVTVDGTRTMMEAARRHGVARVIHLSSIAVYGLTTGTVAESAPMAADLSEYGAWKIAAEEAVLRSSVPAIRLRPTIVYGRGSDLWIDDPLRRLRSGHWGTLGTLGEGTCNPVHVDDVAAAVEAALRAGSSALGAAYNVNGAETLTWNDWFRRLAQAAGLPTPAERSAGRVGWQMASAVPLRALRKVMPVFDPSYLLGVPARGDLPLFGLQAIYPTDAARRELGWAPGTGLAEGLAEAIPRS